MIRFSLIRRGLPAALIFAAMLAAGIVGWNKGYDAATSKYEALISEQQKAAMNLKLAAANKERENAKKLSAALADRDAALRRAGSLRLGSQRVRLQSETVSGALSDRSKANALADDNLRKQLGRCEGLLGEGAKLLGEGGDLASEGAALLERIAADKDTLLAAQLTTE